MLPDLNRLVRMEFLLTLLFLLASVAPAWAEQRLVRVLWDVGRETVYVKAYDRTKPGPDAFTIPATHDDAKKEGFGAPEGYGALRKGDRVRLYVVNYNPIAHVWHESSAYEMIAPEPDLFAAILSSTVTGLTGGMKFPAVGLPVKLFKIDPGSGTGVSDPCSPLHAPLLELTDAASALDSLAEAATKLAADLNLKADAEKAQGIPTQRLFWNTFDNKKALDLINDKAKVFGIDFVQKYTDLKSLLDKADAAVLAVNGKLIAFDRALTRLNASNPAESCAGVVKHRDTVQAFIRGVTAADSSLVDVATKYSTTEKLLKAYSRKLGTTNWRDDAVEVIVKEPVVEQGVLRLDAVFVSPNKKFTERTQRSLVLEVQTHFPALIISSGVGIHGFKFKTLAITQDTTTASDGTAVARGRIAIVDDPKWDKFVPVWIQNVRLVGVGGAGLYATFGTTPDRNIFKNGIAGFSLVVPRWRAAFTGGIIAARGYEEEDLKPLVAKFSDSAGFAIKDAALASLPLEEAKWKQAGYFSITFMLVSF